MEGEEIAVNVDLPIAWNMENVKNIQQVTKAKQRETGKARVWSILPG